MATVKAIKDIHTVSGLRIACKGDSGVAIAGKVPNGSNNWNKVLVRFAGRVRKYWVWPADLRFMHGQKAAKYIAVQVKFERYTQPALPKASSTYTYHFGQNLKLIRESREVSQAKLGRLMGSQLQSEPLAQSTIAYREQCSHSPNGQFTDAAARALGVMPFVFFMPLDHCDVFPNVFSFLKSFSKSLCK